MIITNRQMVDRLNNIQMLSKVELPVRVVHAIKKNYRKLATEYADYDESLKELKVKYPDLKEDNPDLLELLKLEMEVDIYTIPESIFTSSDFNLTIEQFEMLEFMIETE